MQLLIRRVDAHRSGRASIPGELAVLCIAVNTIIRDQRKESGYLDDLRSSFTVYAQLASSEKNYEQ